MAEIAVPLSPALSGPTHKMFVRDLVLDAFVGVHAFEREARQRIRINLGMDVIDRPGAAGDKLENVVSYEDIVVGVRALVAERHVNLIETLAERIATLVLEDRRVREVSVRVEKLDIFHDAGSVGIEIIRRAQ
ncbi:dihydroneopterin aldolase [Roseiterribacter gracilis]|uniref:dihydroneopterin aldolase n=1 Tax=Roseiterribacter gracilis TaxID=2812848 RepID=A0A8S8XEV7_9PROT|nr:diguanylate cyclase [Rhodospirillales bacterium TMPK1]